MKKFFISILTAVMIGATFTGCSGVKGDNDTKLEHVNLSMSASDIVNKLVDKDIVSMPIPVDDKMANEVYHLNLEDIYEYGIAETGISPGVATVVIVKAKEGKRDSVKESLNKILEDKIGKAFYPEEKEVAESSEVKVNGDYVSLFILPEESLNEANKIYEEAFK
ncbi:DUF4358 domain-containing protein [Clostridium sp.]|uniref:DUF4358 domain-containing protein n=1 Tax=Clostridium sp. TaxID=1506 RepID=UPI00261862B2|nr:DUF4358 domain-containing protein [Clostridium sp.]